MYQNDRPGSPRHCRPIQLQFRKETKPVIKVIHKNVQSQIKNLVPVEITLPNSSSLTLRHKAVLSMIDGKINSTLTDDGNQTCNVCKAVPSMMNKIDLALATRSKQKGLAAFSYALQTARDYVAAYPWYRMPCSMHKVLIHGADIMRIAPVPNGPSFRGTFGVTSQKYTKHHTRTSSRTKGNTDLLHCLLVSSDPLLYTLRPKPKPKTLKFCPSVLSLLRESSTPGVHK
ncbi:hypothetical protein FOCC_FOCC013890 [Frankliniella occidentalis]|nr:hypothetical protein FOCC_FOCC013890 [Frankliniella occidentalis]